MPADGFDLEPGEAAAFGSTTASGFDLNIRRGFVPSGGVRMTGGIWASPDWEKTDKVDFELLKTTTGEEQLQQQHVTTRRGTIGTPGQRIFESANLTKDNGAPDGALMNRLLPPKILPPQVRPVSDFIDKPQPIMVMSIIKNVEQSSSAEQSRRACPRDPSCSDEPAVGGGRDLAECRFPMTSTRTSCCSRRSR